MWILSAFGSALFAGLTAILAKCGIRYTDGALTIAPTPDKSLDWAKATYDSPAGRIVSGWRYDGDVVIYEFEIPANLTADVTLPDGRKFTLAPGKHTV